MHLNEATFVYKNMHVATDSNFRKINFDSRNKISQRITKNGLMYIYVYFLKTAFGQKSVSVTDENLWISIPMDIRKSNTIATFKSHMYQHLLEHQ